MLYKDIPWLSYQELHWLCHNLFRLMRKKTLSLVLGEWGFPSQRANNVEPFPCHDIITGIENLWCHHGHWKNTCSWYTIPLNLWQPSQYILTKTNQISTKGMMQGVCHCGIPHLIWPLDHWHISLKHQDVLIWIFIKSNLLYWRF